MKRKSLVVLLVAAALSITLLTLPGSSSVAEAAAACSVEYSIPSRVRTAGIYKGEIKTAANGAVVTWRWAGKSVWNRTDFGRSSGIGNRVFVVRFNSGTVPGSYAMIVKVTGTLCSAQKPFIVVVQ